MYLQVIYSTLSIIAIPMLLTSIQIAIENPGLPLGLSDITPGWKKKTAFTHGAWLSNFVPLYMQAHLIKVILRPEKQPK